ncbi:hypothetical protein BDZ97DRAFT_1181995 [Flammula alnicola]|nr:hypothetical protein BDZ97DRAFT_1181995 [Flammula alnicola]
MFLYLNRSFNFYHPSSCILTQDAMADSGLSYMANVIQTSPRTSSTVFLICLPFRHDLILLSPDWYDNEHGPSRLTVSGFTKAVRYKETNAKAPLWLAVYDLASAVMSSEPTKPLSPRPPRENLLSFPDSQPSTGDSTKFSTSQP